MRLASKKSIDILTLIRAVNLAWSSTKCELEGHSIEYGIILGSLNSIFSAIPQPALRGPRLDISNLTCGKLLQNFGVLYDWNKSALIIDRDTAKIEGFIDLSALKTEDPYEYISGITNSICIVTKKTFSVRIYYNGRFNIQYIFNRKSGVIEERILEEFIPTLTERQTEKEVAIKVLDASLRISEIRRGGSIFLGSLINPSMLSERTRQTVSSYVPEKVATLPMSIIIQYATEDGATWVDERGMVRGHGMTFIGPGGRQAIAKYIISKYKTTTAVVASQDGEIKILFQDELKPLASQTTSDRLFSEQIRMTSHRTD